MKCAAVLLCLVVAVAAQEQDVLDSCRRCAEDRLRGPEPGPRPRHERHEHHHRGHGRHGLGPHGFGRPGFGFGFGRFGPRPEDSREFAEADLQDCRRCVDGLRQQPRPTPPAQPEAPVRYSGMRTSGTTILDSLGKPLILHGINYPHSWYKNDAAVAIPAIAATGANVVRIVLSNGAQYTYDDAESVKALVDLCSKNKLIAILEVHDATGNDDVQALQRAADYWISMASTLQGLEDRVIINIANEWMGSWGQPDAWASGYISVIPQLRKAGLKHIIMVDSAGWGQDAAVIAQRGRDVLQSDPERNLVFTIHMYEAAGADEATIKKHIDNSLAVGAPVVITEFSNKQNGKEVAYKAIMQYTAQRDVGWLAWSWYGNNADTANMDMADGMAGNNLTPLGNELVNGQYGIKSRARLANVAW